MGGRRFRAGIRWSGCSGIKDGFRRSEDREDRMPKFLLDKLKSEYGANSKIPYKVANSLGAMRGNRETKKGAEMEKKHEARLGRKGVKK
jgi:hypothetical protein